MSPTQTIIQWPSLILPTVWVTGLETEAVADLLEHTSLEFHTDYLQEKEIHVRATEVVVAGVPGNLWVWVELSPYPSVNSLDWPLPWPTSTTYWAAIGGGGGALVPVVPLLEVAAGVNGRVHTMLLPWTIHSPWARVVVQTPVAAALPNASWIVQVLVSAKNP